MRGEREKRMAEFRVTQIIAKRICGGQTEVLVQWAATWKPLDETITKGHLWEEFLEDETIEGAKGEGSERQP